MRALTVLSVLLLTSLRSDIAKVYAPGKEPMLVSGSAASNSAGAGVQQPAGKELASLANQHLAHTYGDLSR